ncbi:hypothetical protein Tco_0795794 [Tanacetum coccineum]
MSEPMPTIPTQSPFTYPNPNPSASPSFTQDDTSESFIPEPTQPMPTFTQTAFSQPAFSQPNQSIFSQPAVHFQQTQPTQTNQTGHRSTLNNVQSTNSFNVQTATILHHCKISLSRRSKILRLGYEDGSTDTECLIISLEVCSEVNSPKRLGKICERKYELLLLLSLLMSMLCSKVEQVRTLLLQALLRYMPDFHHYVDARVIWMAVRLRFGGMRIKEDEDDMLQAAVYRNSL